MQKGRRSKLNHSLKKDRKVIEEKGTKTVDPKVVEKEVAQRAEQEVGNKEEDFKEQKRKNMGRIELLEKVWLGVHNKFDNLVEEERKEAGKREAVKEAAKEQQLSTTPNPKTDTRNSFKSP